MIHWAFAHNIMIYNNKLKIIFCKDKNSKNEIMRLRHSIVPIVYVSKVGQKLIS